MNSAWLIVCFAIAPFPNLVHAAVAFFAGEIRRSVRIASHDEIVQPLWTHIPLPHMKWTHGALPHMSHRFQADTGKHRLDAHRFAKIDGKTRESRWQVQQLESEPAAQLLLVLFRLFSGKRPLTVSSEQREISRDVRFDRLALDPV